MHAAESIAESDCSFGTSRLLASCAPREIFQHGEGLRPPRLDDNRLPVCEPPHVQLAGGGPWIRTVRDPVDHASARTADPLAAVRVECNRVFALANEVFVDDVEHLEKRHVGRDVLRDVIDETAGLILRRLTPDAQIYCDRLR
jgi:hypothetical protein